MRQARLGGTCHDCGRQSDTGLYWENCLRVLDFGVPDMIYEPDTTEPVRCDACEGRASAQRAARS